MQELARLPLCVALLDWLHFTCRSLIYDRLVLLQVRDARGEPKFGSFQGFTLLWRFLSLKSKQTHGQGLLSKCNTMCCTAFSSQPCSPTFPSSTHLLPLLFHVIVMIRFLSRALCFAVLPPFHLRMCAPSLPRRLLARGKRPVQYA